MPCETLGKHVGSVRIHTSSIRAEREIFIIINTRGSRFNIFDIVRNINDDEKICAPFVKIF